MPIKKDITGQMFGRLIALAPDIKYTNGKSRTFWKCECQCNLKKIVNVRLDALLGGKTISCGCFASESVSKRFITHGNSIKSKSSEYRTWQHICARCNNKNNLAYKNYGGRGISVCDRWLGENGFKNFLEDLGKKPEDNYSVDRIDVNGNYEPSNCKWIPKTEQAKNKRTSITFVVDGITWNLMDYCKQHNIHYDTVRCRINNNWDIDIALKTPSAEFIARQSKVSQKTNFLQRKKINNYNSLEDDLTFEESLDVLKSQNYKCAYFDDCNNSEENGCKLQIDHKVAKVNNGHDTKENIQWVCRSCNSSKGTRDKPKPMATRNKNRGSLDKSITKQSNVERS